jgi:diguanylate cyclase (GGDEF)-like protein/PAS domain S-box-containing protein
MPVRAHTHARQTDGHASAETALRESEALLRESQQIARLGSYVFDCQAQSWTGSDVLYEVLGIEKSCARTLDSWIGLIHPGDLPGMIAQFNETATRDGNLFEAECRLTRQSDQALRWVHVLGRLESDKQGQPLSLRGTIQDITEHKLADTALHESQELLQLFIQHAPAALAMLDREMRYLAVSRRWIEIHELGSREIIGRSHYEILPLIPEPWKDEHRRALTGEALQSAEDCMPRPDGTIQWVRREVRPWLTGLGEVGGVVLFAEDITERRRAAEWLQLAASVFTHASEGIAITEVDGTILDVNDSFTRITGYSREEILGRNPRILNSGRQSKEFYSKMWHELLQNGHWAGEIWNRAKDGRVYAEMLTITAVRDPSGRTKHYVALFSDLTSFKEQEQQLQRVAHFDLLTGLPNRVLLRDRLHQAMVQAHRRGNVLAVACLDLDDFKGINDRHGHSTGDRLLATIALRMKAALREDDTLARLGGDEFVAVLLEFPTVEETLPVISRLLHAASEPVQVDDFVLHVSASVGIAYFPQADDVDADQLLRQAGQAMYQSKLEGKNRYHIFDPRLDRSLRSHHEDVERVRAGLASREFVLFYQPKVNMATGAVLGAEALIRWQHPGRGLLSPAVFLPVIEGHPVALELGEWVIECALTQMEQWRNAGLDLPVSVNVSSQLLQMPDFVDRLSKLLARHPGIAPSQLEIEVLESSALLDVPQVSKMIHACRRLGVSFALDDFGTGYSSLSYLKRLSVDVLKIDQTFVRDMLGDPDDLTIIEGMLGLAAAFRRVAVAEGVETIEQGLLLLRLGCQAAQGYGIARPMPAGELPGWVASWRTDPHWLGVAAVDLVDRPLLYAGAEHSGWVAAIHAYLEGLRQVPPALAHHQCRFGAWMDSEDLSGRRSLPGFHNIASTHRQLHTSAADILRLKAENHDKEARDRLPELCSLRDRLLEELDRLMQRQ